METVRINLITNEKYDVCKLLVKGTSIYGTNDTLLYELLKAFLSLLKTGEDMQDYYLYKKERLMSDDILDIINSFTTHGISSICGKACDILDLLESANTEMNVNYDNYNNF